MKLYNFGLLFLFAFLFNIPGLCQQEDGKVIAKKFVRIFDAKSFQGWEGDTLHSWRIEDGAIVGGSLEETVQHNNFLTTKKRYGNFILNLKFKLVSKEGFMNAGVQFRSERLVDPAYEMTGYQADLGPKFWASLYDESRRNVTLVFADSSLINKLLKPDDWNDYTIKAHNNHIEIFLNGHQTVDYREKDKSIPGIGLIGLQIHGGGKTVVYYKDILINEMP